MEDPTAKPVIKELFMQGVDRIFSGVKSSKRMDFITWSHLSYASPINILLAYSEHLVLRSYIKSEHLRVSERKVGELTHGDRILL